MATETPEEFAASLLRAASLTQAGVVAITRETAKAVKTDWQQAWVGIRTKRKLHRAITYRTVASRAQVAAEIGVIPSATRALGGSFAHIIEFGSASGNAPRNDGGQALLRHTDDYTARLAYLAGALLASVGPVGLGVSFTDEARFNPAE